MKEYEVERFYCYDACHQAKLKELLNKMAKQGWILKTILYQPGQTYADLIFERKIQT